MALLSETDRQKIWRGLMRYWSRLLEGQPYVKAELRAAVNAQDQWFEDNAPSANAALPLPFRTAATPSQKAALAAAVLLARYNPALLRDLIGEVD